MNNQHHGGNNCLPGVEWELETVLAKNLQLFLTCSYDLITFYPGFKTLGYSAPAVHPEDSLFFPQKSGLQMSLPL